MSSEEHPAVDQPSEQPSPESKPKRHVSEATRQKMRDAKLGRKQSPEHVAKRVAARKGRPMSDQARLNIRNAHVGKPLTPEHRAAISAGIRKAFLERQEAERLAESNGCSDGQSEATNQPEQNAPL